MDGENSHRKISRLLPYFLILVFSAAVRFYNLINPLNYPGYRGCLGNNGADEGIFLMTARLVSSGFRMYTDVNTHQGPLFSYIFSIMNGDPLSTRTMTVIIALFGLVGIILISELTASRTVGIISSIFLSMNYLYFKESRHASFELYSSVLLVFAFYMILLYYRKMEQDAGKGERTWSGPVILMIFSGILFSLAAMSKLFAVIPLIFTGAYILLDRSKVFGDGRDLRIRVVHITILAVSTLLTTMAVMSIFGFSETLNGMFLSNLNRPAMSWWEKAVTLLKFLGITSIPLLLSVVAMVKSFRERIVRLMMIWSIPLFLLLIIQSPMWDHYFVMILPPVSLLGGIGAKLLLGNASIEEKDIPTRGNVKHSGYRVPVMILLTAFILITSGINTTLVLATEKDLEREIAREISSISGYDDFIISGDPIIPVYANRLQPPEATNLAQVRYPELSDLDLINITCRYDVKVVVFTYHLTRFDGYVDFIRENFIFLKGYERPDRTSTVEGEIVLSDRTFNVYVRPDELDLEQALKDLQLGIDGTQSPPNSQGE